MPMTTLIAICSFHLDPCLLHPSIPHSHRLLEQNYFDLLALDQIPVTKHPIHHSIRCPRIATKP